VLAVISITLVVILGSYSSWATVHALNGAVRTVEAGLLNARAMAKTQNAYVLFSHYTPEPAATNTLKQLPLYSIWINTNDMATSEEMIAEDFVQMNTQRINRHVTLHSLHPPTFSSATPASSVIFAPDGSLWVDTLAGELPNPHYLMISTRRYFAVHDRWAEPLSRVIRIDYATGQPTVMRYDQLPGHTGGAGHD